jgi:hypothetical protein
MAKSSVTKVFINQTKNVVCGFAFTKTRSLKHFQYWAISTIPKNHWSINFQGLGNCPMPPPWIRRITYLSSTRQFVNRHFVNNISSTTFRQQHFVNNISSTDISSTSHFVDSTSSTTFCRKFFVEKHFVDKTFCRQIFCRHGTLSKDVLSTRHFVEKYFVDNQCFVGYLMFPFLFLRYHASVFISSIKLQV